MFNTGDIVKLVGPYDGLTYHVRVIGPREGMFGDLAFKGEVIYNEFDTSEYPGCAVGTVSDDFMYIDFVVVYHAIS
ncbi:hypothetical protein vBPpSSYP_35 [Pseudomonas phage vB_PpS_SYP]|nr:hypothetical protein vBPpSSYP_35 [Pseudomonas phage vB_PpS_SYP]